MAIHTLSITYYYDPLSSTEGNYASSNKNLHCHNPPIGKQCKKNAGIARNYKFYFYQDGNCPFGACEDKLHHCYLAQKPSVEVQCRILKKISRLHN